MSAKFECLDILNINNEDINGLGHFDLIIISGLIHHLKGNVDQIFYILNKLSINNTKISVIEPNYYYFLSKIRQLWYKIDSYFDEKSEIIVPPELIVSSGIKNGFILEQKISYRGGPAYFLILQSMILRIPKRLKYFLYALLFLPEKFIDNLPLPRVSYPYLSITLKYLNSSKS